MPAVFVILWSSGFVGAKFGLPSAPPATFLALRFVFVVALLAPLIWLMRAPWPASSRQAWHLAVTGVLVQAGYLGGVFFSIDHGMSAGLSALIVGLQPVLTAFVAAPLLGERLSPRQWLGVALGFAGTALVVWNKINVANLTLPAIGFSVIALLAMTSGTLYQKRFAGNFDLRTGALVQFAAAFVVMLPLALLETRPVEWTAGFVGALAWLVVVLSIGAISLLALLIRRGAATRVVSLFYLVPPTTALMAFAMFGERLTGLAMIGMVVSVIGVALVVKQS
jgi:drug/metabolite transporter (DMT)-like permease